MQRPICVHCGKAYGRRDIRPEYLVWACGTPVPEQKLEGQGVKLDMHRKAPHPATGTFMGKPYNQNDNVAIREVWNGEWITSYEPFCTLRCAHDYACKAWAQGQGAKRFRG